MAQRCWWLMLIALGACFSPKFNDGAIQCGPDELCPPGFECAAGVCRSDEQPIADAPTDSPGMVRLTLIKSGTGMGGVTSVPAGLDCGASCVGSFPAGTMVTLTAAPLSGSTFTRWSGGACSGAATTCSFTLTADTAVTADFGVIMRTLTVVAGGNGTGSITSTPAGITCPGVCTLQIPNATQVVLSATPTGGSTFLAWTGPGSCTGTGTCTFTITADTTVTGSFALDYSVLVDKTGTGTGTVSSSPAGIDCGVDCSEAYGVNTVVTLVAAASADSNFIGWSGGGCGGTGTCVVTVTAAVMVTAMFDLQQFPLVVGFDGTGAGTVTSSPSGISCPGTCGASYASGTMVTLTATPAADSTFTGWSEASCGGTGPCTVTVVATTSVIATFTRKTYTLDILKPGTGDGVVEGLSGRIDCGADCSEVVDHGTTLTLTATQFPGSVFSGWTAPGCSTALTCPVTVTADTTVAATFTLTTHVLTTSVTGNGSVSSAPAGISCGSTCSATFDYNTLVTLTPSPGTGSSFAGWSGVCLGFGLGDCIVTMDQARTVDALFTVDSYPLDVVLAGMGAGSVTSNPPGIACDPGAAADCTESYVYDTNVMLVANASAPSFFVGWSGGGCSGSNNVCVVDMISAQTVTANFSPPPNKMFVTSQTFVPGMLGGLVGADMACQQAANNALPPLPGTYRAWLSSSSVNAIDRLGAASGWIRTDNRAFANDKADIGNGLIYHPPRIDENGVDVFDVTAVTATTLGGVYNPVSLTPPQGDCANYTSTAGTLGAGTTAGGSYMFMVYLNPFCADQAHLYCFGVDRTSTVIPNPPTVAVRRAFMRYWVPGSGIANADAQCQADATAYALPGTYRALLATTTNTALGRFNLSGPPWFRVDDVPILPMASQWASASYFETGPNLTGDGTYNWGNVAHWTGAPNLTSFGTLATTCNNWTDQNALGTFGIAGHTRLNMFFSANSFFQCNFTGATITCLQE